VPSDREAEMFLYAVMSFVVAVSLPIWTSDIDQPERRRALPVTIQSWSLTSLQHSCDMPGTSSQLVDTAPVFLDSRAASK